MKILYLIFLILILISQKCAANVTDKVYASFPPLFYHDNYDNCMLLENEALYCSFEFHLHPLSAENPIWQAMQELSMDSYNYRHDILRHWICVPLSCQNYNKTNINLSDEALKEIVTDCYNRKIYSYGLEGNIAKLKCETSKSKYPVDWIDIFAMIFFVTYVTLVLFCTIYEYTTNSVEENEKTSYSYWDSIFLSFSLKRNWNRLKIVKDDTDTEYLKPIQGIRFYITIFVILSHTALANIMIPVSNIKYVETMNSKVGNLFLSSGPLCTSIFLLISSSLLAYGIFTYIEKKKLSKYDLVMIFINRYLRLAPSLGVIILFNMTWWRHMGSGPHWQALVGKEYLRCRKNWWTNMLFLNTIIDRENMCSPTFWYLGLDTQYFILLLILLWYIIKYKKYIWYILGSLLSLNIVGTYVYNYVNDFEAFLIPRPESAYDMKFIVGNPQWHGQMVSFIGHTAGPIIGVGFGYIFYKTKNVKLFQERKLMWNILYHILVYGVVLATILIPGWYILVERPDHDPVVASIIAASGRALFVSAVAVGIFGAMHGIGGPIVRILRWNPAYILGRITYGAYLVHFTLIVSRPATARNPVYVSDMYIVYYLLGDVASAYLAGLIMTLLFEMPISALQKMLIPVYPREIADSKKEE